MQKLQCVFHQLIHLNIPRLVDQPAHTRQLAEVVQESLHFFCCGADALDVRLQAVEVAAPAILADKTQESADGNQRRFQIV